MNKTNELIGILEEQLRFVKMTVTEREYLENTIKKLKKAINYTRCCESDSELLLGFLDKLERIDALKHTENWQKKTYVASYLKAK